jgi:tetratricopeptide (TPR) repeat protein
LGEANRAIEFYNQALAIAREIGDRAEEGHLLTNLGIASSNLGESKQALGFLKQALDIALQIGDRHSVAATLIQLSRLALVEGEYAEAVRLGAQALALFRALASPYEGTIANWLAQLSDKLGLSEKEFQLIIQDAGVEILIPYNCGHNHFLGTKFCPFTGRAIKPVAIPAEIPEREPPESIDPKAYWLSLGRRYEHEQNWPAAIDAYQKARALFTPAEMTEVERRQYLEINSRLAASLKQAQRWPEALALQRENFKTYQQLGDLKRQADTYMEIGHLNQLLDDYEEAWFHYLDAYRLYRRANAGQGDKLGMAAASEALGTLELFAYMLPQAIRDLEDARQLYHAMNLAGKATLVEEVLKRAQKDLQEREAVFSS